jgi:uncharacterized membrane protein YeiB
LLLDMSNIAETSDWHPVIQSERCHTLDALRGLALLGVLLVNLLSDFRVSLADHILNFHTHPGWANRVVDVLVQGRGPFCGRRHGATDAPDLPREGCRH